MAWAILGTVAYGLIAVILARMIAGACAYRYGPPEAEDWIVGLFVGLLAGAFWPLILVGLAVRYMPAPRLADERAERLKVGEFELVARKAHLRSLERELRIGQSER